MGKLNPKLSLMLKEQKIDITEGTLALLGLTHGLEVTTIIKEDTINKLVLKGFIERVYTSSTKKHYVQLNVPVYEKQEIEWAWVEKEFMKLFVNMKPTIAMLYDETKKRMIKFFQENPSVRKDDVIRATKLYLSEIDDVTYLQAPHYFIRKDKGIAQTSRLKAYLDKLSRGSSAVRQHTVR